MADERVTCLSCGVFRMEIEALVSRGKLDCDIVAIDSMLHMKPAKLEQEMGRIMEVDQNGRFLLLYGDCHPHMDEMQKRENATRVAGINCCEILLGRAAYRELQRKKVFIFLPEWTRRWREIFTRELGFGEPGMAQTFMKEHCRRLLYVDTGVMPVPGDVLREISGYFNMPVEVMRISLDTLLKGINDALRKIMERSH